ncbi:MAG TPA: hypothetical protein PLH84_09045 [Candidatus Krumholzibacteria bacterium]|nr:hypothetical protein [Candidatus Krumholzibacteria bacterium]
MKNGFPFHAYRSTAAWRLLPLLLAVLVLALIAGGCSDEENTDVTQTPFPEPELQPWLLDVWGTGPDDVYVVGQPNVLLHWNGSAWTLVDGIGPDVLTAVWGTGTGTVYAVGHGGAILRGSGTSFTGMASGTEENLYDVGAGPYDAIYAVGEKGAIRRLSGNTWVSTQQLAYRYSDQDVALDTLVLNEDIQSLTTVNPYGLAGDHASVLMENDIPAYDHEWLWGAISDTTGFIKAGAYGDALEDTYLGNKLGRVLRLVDDPADGLTWELLADANGDEARPATFPQAISGLWFDAANARLLITTSAGRIGSLMTDGSASEILYADTAWLSSVWGAGNGEIWACGKEGVVLYSDDDGLTWTQVEVPLPDTSGKSGIGKYGRLDP